MADHEALAGSVQDIKTQRTRELLEAGLSAETLGIAGGTMYDQETRRHFPRQVVGELVSIE